jgi:hypothetical protein
MKALAIIAALINFQLALICITLIRIAKAIEALAPM